MPNIQHQDIEAIQRVLHSGWFTMGPKVQQFEKGLSQYLDMKYAVATSTGTSALDIALKCLGITTGDEIILPALTYIATGNAILYNNGKPVFVDIDDTLTIDTTLIEERITDKTKAIITVDLAGNVSNYDELQRISQENGIPLVVDGAQSLGSEYHGVKCCTHGLLNTISFHAAKIITTIEGGMVLTNEKKLFLKAQSLRNQGETTKYYHPNLGNNYRMTDIMGALGNAQLARLQETLSTRKEKAEYYKRCLKGVSFPQERKNTTTSNLFFLILADRRDELDAHLHERDIETRIIYPMPLNEQPVFQPFSSEEFSVAKKISQQVLSLPLYQQLSTDQQEAVIRSVNDFYS